MMQHSMASREERMPRCGSYALFSAVFTKASTPSFGGIVCVRKGAGMNIDIFVRLLCLFVAMTFLPFPDWLIYHDSIFASLFRVVRGFRGQCPPVSYSCRSRKNRLLPPMVMVFGLFVAFGTSPHPAGFATPLLVCNINPDAFQLNETAPLVGRTESGGAV
jgi:hypothetical protein